MLFLLDRNGTPSHASIIAINTGLCNNPLTLSQVVLNQSACAASTRVKAAGGTGGSYVWTIDGATFISSSSYVYVATSVSAPTVQVQVKQSESCGASTTLTTYFPHCTPSCIICNQ